MLTTKETEKRKQVKFICVEDLVPQDHLLRKVEKLADFSFIRKEVKELYCEDYKEQPAKLAKHYNKQLLEEINRDREDTGKKPYGDDDFPPEEKTITKSKTDPESGLFHKGEHKICFAYNVQTACNKHNFVLDVRNQKVICRHVWQDYLDEVEHIRRTDYGKAVYSKRSQTIERVFADAKEKHGLRYARHMGKAKVKAQVLMTFACMNLKKIIKMLGGGLNKPHNFVKNILKVLFNSKNNLKLVA